MTNGAGSATSSPPSVGLGEPFHRHSGAPDRAERSALPLHLRSAAAALFDDLPDRLRGGSVDDAIAGFAKARGQLAVRVPSGKEVTVDAYRVRLVATCPAAAAGGDDGFRWAPGTAARHLGLRALALHLGGDAAQPVEQAAAAVVAELIRSGGERTPGPWLAQLDRAGRAVAQAEAQRWAEQAVAWLPLRLVDPRSLRLLRDDWWPGGARGERTLVVHGRRDLTVDVAGRRVGVTVAGGMASGPGAADADALGALAATLCDPRARLVRVVRVHPASGEVVATDVTPGLLARGLDVALATASALASGGSEVATRPGPLCTWCDHRGGCRPGTAWLCRPDRRAMGLPVHAWSPAGSPAGPSSPGMPARSSSGEW